MKRKIFTVHDAYRDVEDDEEEKFTDLMSLENETKEKRTRRKKSVLRLSLQDIIVEEQQRLKDKKSEALNASAADDDDEHGGDEEQRELEMAKKFCVTHKDQTGRIEEKVVKIKVFNILFNDTDCSLVYMQDLTNFFQESEANQQKEQLLTASECISE